MPINSFMPSGLFHLKSLDRSISHIRVVWLVFIITMFFFRTEITNIVDPGLHCLPMSLLWDTRLKWVNITCCEYSLEVSRRDA